MTHKQKMLLQYLILQKADEAYKEKKITTAAILYKKAHALIPLDETRKNRLSILILKLADFKYAAGKYNDSVMLYKQAQKLGPLPLDAQKRYELSQTLVNLNSGKDQNHVCKSRLA